MRGLAIVAAIAIFLAGCGADDPDSYGFPWHERPTSAPTLVPVPTPDGDGTTGPHTDEDQDQEIDLLVRMLTDQGFSVRGVHDTWTTDMIEEGVHYTELTRIEEYGFIDDELGDETTRFVVANTLEADGSIEVFEQVSSMDGEVMRQVAGSHWRQYLTGERDEVQPVEPPEKLGPGEMMLSECDGSLLSYTMSDDSGNHEIEWRLHPADSEEAWVLVPSLWGDDDAHLMGYSHTMVCHGNELLLVLHVGSGFDPETGYPIAPQRVIVWFDITGERPLRVLGDIDPVASTAEGLIGVQPSAGVSSVRRIIDGEVGTEVVSLPSGDRVVWNHLAASDDHILLTLHSRSVTTRDDYRSSGNEIYIVSVNVVTAEARIFTQLATTAWQDWRAHPMINNGFALVVPPAMQGLRPALLMSLDTGAAARIPESPYGSWVTFDGEAAIAKEIIGMRVPGRMSERPESATVMSESVFVIGQLTDPATW